MAEPIESRILNHMKSSGYRPQRARGLAKELGFAQDESYGTFREALRELMDSGRVIQGARGAIVLPPSHGASDEFVGTYRHNRRGFGFVVPRDPSGHEDLFIPPGENMGALTGDTVRAKITQRGQRDGKAYNAGRISEIITRGNKQFVGTLTKTAGQWVVMPDGNTLTAPIATPDAAARHIKPGTKVVVELTSYPTEYEAAVGVITEVLGKAGEKDVDLRSVIIQFGLREKFEQDVLDDARRAVDAFAPDEEAEHREDLSDQVICTIDPDDAKDYDDAISLTRLDDGTIELGVHIADVSHFVVEGSPLDVEARERGNSVYFPGYVIPMLPEILSNGVCSLQEGVPRLCKSVFIDFDEDGRPLGSRVANTVIRSAKRLRYREAQAIIDGAAFVPHPEGDRKISDYPREVVALLGEMDRLAKVIQKRRLAAGQLVLNLPEVDLVLDDEGRVVGTAKEDTSFTHTLIEMFMVEANEAVARLLAAQGVPFIRRVHPTPDLSDTERLKHFVDVTGYRLPKELDRKALQALLTAVAGKPEAYAINLAILKSLTRAEYSPKEDGHFALASEYYCHFTSPIRRYADLTVHRLIDQFIEGRNAAKGRGGRKAKVVIEGPDFKELLELGKHISYTERRAEDAESELRQIKILDLLKERVGDVFPGVVTGIANFGLFVQLSEFLIEGVIRYEDLLDDWWDVDDKAGLIRGQRTGMRIGIGDTVEVYIARVDPPRRELSLALKGVTARARHAKSGGPSVTPKTSKKHQKHRPKGERKFNQPVGGNTRRNMKAKRRGR